MTKHQNVKRKKSLKEKNEIEQPFKSVRKRINFNLIKNNGTAFVTKIIAKTFANRKSDLLERDEGNVR